MVNSTLNSMKTIFYTLLIVIVVFIVGSYYYKISFIDTKIEQYKMQRDSIQSRINTLKGDRLSLFRVTDSLKNENVILKDRISYIAKNLTQTISKYENLRGNLRYLDDDGQLRYFAEQVSK